MSYELGLRPPIIIKLFSSSSLLLSFSPSLRSFPRWLRLFLKCLEFTSVKFSSREDPTGHNKVKMNHESIFAIMSCV